MKPGWKTSEFWIAAASTLGALLTILGVLPKEDTATITGALNDLVGKGFAFAAAAWVVVSYIKGRVEIKKAGALLIALFLFGAQAQAQPVVRESVSFNYGQPVAVKKACFGGGGNSARMERLLEQLIQQNQQILTLLQQMVFQQQYGAPLMNQRQQQPIYIYRDLPGDAPHRELPGDGPRRELPADPPRRELPPDPPKRELPGDAPKRELPPVSAPFKRDKDRELPKDAPPGMPFVTYTNGATESAGWRPVGTRRP